MMTLFGAEETLLPLAKEYLVPIKFVVPVFLFNQMLVAFFSIAWTVSIWAVPNGFIRVFMAPTEAVCRIAPSIMFRYGISFLLLPLNVFSTYYFQSLMKPGASLLVSVARGIF